MIDNPLPDQVMQEKETLQKAADFEAYCKFHAIEIATHYKVYAALHDYFAEWYHDYMQQNPGLFDLSWSATACKPKSSAKSSISLAFRGCVRILSKEHS